MNLDAPDEATIRKIESSVLDTEFRRFKILKVSSNTSIPFFLKAYGDAARDSVLMDDYPEFTHRRILHQLMLAIGQCIKWVVANEDQQKTEPIHSLEEIQDDVNNLLKWAFEYVGLVQQFTAWSRGYVEIGVNESEKEIRFTPIDDNLAYSYYSQQEIGDSYIDSIFSDILSSNLISETFNSWAREYKIKEPPIAAHIDWTKAAKSKLFEVIYAKTEKYILPELSADSDLGGYTLQQFRIFYTSLFINFRFICSFEQYLDSKDRESAYAFGSNPIVFPKSKMIAFIRSATGLAEPQVSAILEDLTLDLDNFQSNLTSQPIVLSPDHQYSILPNLFANIEPNRMLSGALNKSALKRKIYDKLIGEIERKNIQAIKTFLEENTSYNVLRQSFKGKVKKEISPDFVLVDKENNSILIVEYKHFLNPSNALETAFRISEMQKGFLQVKGYETFFYANHEVLHSFGIKSGFSIFKILLTRVPTAVPVSEPEVIVTDWETFKIAIVKPGSFSEIGFSLQRDKRIELEAEHFESMDFITKAGDWKFIRTVRTGKKQDNDKNLNI